MLTVTPSLDAQPRTSILTSNLERFIPPPTFSGLAPILLIFSFD